MHIKLSDRQQQVLWATVRHYVATAKPVGSGALIEEFNLNVSSATVRNAMGRLEKAGLLYQPHTSAGRVPSDSGYRIYVDHLIKPSDRIARQVDQLLSDQLQAETYSVDVLLRHAAQILSNISGYIALVTLPQSRTAHLRHVQLVQVDTRRIMLVVVLDCYETQSVLITLPQLDTPTDPESLDRELQILSNFLTQQLRERSLSDLSTLDWTELGREFEQYASLLQQSLNQLSRRSQTPIPTQILVSGVAEVLRRQPEFSELQQVQTLMQLLEEEQDQLWPLIFETTDPGTPRKRVVVRIGSENPIKPMNACALVSATYQRDNVPVGSVGMLGPTRMVYEDAIALVEAAADHLSDVMSQAT